MLQNGIFQSFLRFAAIADQLKQVMLFAVGPDGDFSIDSCHHDCCKMPTRWYLEISLRIALVLA